MVDVNDLETDLKGQVLLESCDTASTATGRFVYNQVHSAELSLSFTRNRGFKYSKKFEVLAAMLLTFQVFQGVRWCCWV